MKSFPRSFCAVLLFAWLLVGCGPAQPASTPTVTLSPSPLASQTATLTLTIPPTLTGTPSPSQTPTPSHTPRPTGTATPTQIPVKVVIESMSGAAELVTVKSSESFSHVYRQRNGSCIFLPQDDTRIYYFGKGEVRAGIDLAALSPANIQVSGGRVNVSLPAPKIIAQTAMYEVSEILSPFSLCGNVSPRPATWNDIQKLANEAVLKASCEGGILTEARTNAHGVLHNLLLGLGFDDARLDIPYATGCP